MCCVLRTPFCLNGSPIHPKKTPLIGQRYAVIIAEAEVPAGESFVVDKICTVFTDRDPGAEREKAWDTCSRGRKKDTGISGSRI